jgi:hypothetical protein
MAPHCAPWTAHVFGEQLACPHTFGEPPPPHVSPGAQSPQWTLPPHPFGMSPQVAPGGHCVIGAHAGAPHLLGMPPPPHVVPVGHVGHVSVPPQPSPV